MNPPATNSIKGSSRIARRAPLPSRAPMRVVSMSAADFERITSEMSRMSERSRELVRRILVDGERLMEVAREYRDNDQKAGAKQMVSRLVLEISSRFLAEAERCEAALVEATLVLPATLAKELAALQLQIAQQEAAAAVRTVEPLRRAALRLRRHLARDAEAAEPEQEAADSESRDR